MEERDHVGPPVGIGGGEGEAGGEWEARGRGCSKEEELEGLRCRHGGMWDV